MDGARARRRLSADPATIRALDKRRAAVQDTGEFEPHVAAALGGGFASRRDAIDGRAAAGAPDRRAPAERRETTAGGELAGRPPAGGSTRSRSEAWR